MGRRVTLVLLALGALFSFAIGVRSWRWHQEHGWGPYRAGDEHRLEAMADACVRAAERVRNPP